MNVLFIDTAHQSLWDGLEQVNCHCTLDNISPKEQIQQTLKNYQGVVIRSRFKIDKEFLDHGKHLRFIARVGAGLENIDCDYAKSLGINLIAAPQGNRQAVGEHALGMLLTLMRRTSIADNEVRHGKWIREGNRGEEISKRTVGIIGYGNTGGAFARCISGFGVKTLAYDIKDGDYSDEFACKASLEEIYSQADIVSLHVPLTELTKGMANKAFFDSFAKPIYFINAARGACCVTDDLVEAMEKGIVKGAALDVLEYEKTSFEDFFSDSNLPKAFEYLINSENVVLTPHIGGWTHQSNEKMAAVIVDQVAGLLVKDR